MGVLVGHAPFFCDSFLDGSAEIVVSEIDDDLPPPHPVLAARYAAMTDEELLVELWSMTRDRRVQ